MNRVACCLLLVSLLLACSSAVELKQLGLRYEPPQGMALKAEEAGAPAVARFERGLELRSVEGAPPKLGAAPEEVLAAAGISEPGKRLSATQGTLPAGEVARYEFEQGASRTMMYFLPRKERFVLVVYTAPESEYGPGSARVERSLSSLRFTR